jgi:tetratricopeptide (TPR) repeat protein
MSLWTARLDFPKVEQLYLRALELDGNCAPAHNELGLLLWDGLGRPEEAERHFQSAIEAAPDDPRGHGMYAVYLMEFKQDKEGAERHFKAALELDPTDAQNHLDHGRLLFDLYFEDDAALAEMQKAIELQPRYADAYLWLAKVELIAFHDPESARSALLEGFRIIRGPGVRQSTLEKMATEQMHVWIKSELKRCGDLPDEAVELRKMDLEVWGDRRHR